MQAFRKNSRDVDRREVAIRELLPRWSGFHCSDVSGIKLTPMTADMALADLTDVTKQLEFLRVKDNLDCQPHKWNVKGLDVAKVSNIKRRFYLLTSFFLRFLPAFLNQKSRN